MSGRPYDNSINDTSHTGSTSTSSNAIFSIRIVTVDHYMHFPVPELDPCYSEFRGSVVSKVPVIRIFGTDADGTKTCAHVHGVFPYLYVPYDDSGKADAADGADRLTYQMAASLDKALNISLGQSSSDAEHVFKIVHVQGIPFYGYHQKAHQFLKIYLYNPGLVRRVGTLLQNGAILGRIFQPHEVHVPYVLQFMIDYNLYGMSFLHSPADQLHYRAAVAEGDPIVGRRRRQILKRLERTSTSKQELDLIASYILNRLEINADSSVKSAAGRSHANPGIATIWTDERIRRQRLTAAANATDSLPALEVPLPEERPLARPTESNQFHLDALRSKLDHAGDDTNISSLLMDQTTLNGTLSNANQSKFNLRRLLANSVYPSECSQQTGNLLNASCIVDHQPSAARQARSRRSQHNAEQQASWLNESIVDESLVLSLSQPAGAVADVTLNDVEFELLDVMQQLEQNDTDAVEGASPIDDDSILAPLSQIASQAIRNPAAAAAVRSQTANQSVTNSSPTAMDTEDTAAPAGQSLWDDSDIDPDDNLLNDFSVCWNENDPDTGALAKRDADDHALASLRIPQLDGADTPRKTTDRAKYAALNVIVKTPVPLLPKRSAVMALKAVPEKRQCLSEPFIERIDLTLSDDDDDDVDLENVPNPNVNGSRPPDVRFVDCRLRAVTPVPKCQPDPLVLRTEAIPLVVDVQADASVDRHSPLMPSTPKSIAVEYPQVRLRRYTDIEAEYALAKPPPSPEEQCTIQATPPTTPRRTLRSRTAKAPVPVVATPAKTRAKRVLLKKTAPDLDELYDRINCHVASMYDKKHNFYPEPGPSTINYYADINIPGYYTPAADTKVPNAKGRQRKTTAAKADEKRNSESVVIVPLLRSHTFDEALVAMEQYGIPYSNDNINESVPMDELDVFSSDVLDSGEGFNARTLKLAAGPKQARKKRTPTPTTITDAGFTAPMVADTCTVLPLLRAPTYIEVFDAMPAYDLPYVTATEPFFSDPADAIARAREVGPAVLCIPTRTLADLDGFVSEVLGDGEGLAAHKNKLAIQVLGRQATNSKEAALNAKLMLSMVVSDQEASVMHPVLAAPSPSEAKQWEAANIFLPLNDLYSRPAVNGDRMIPKQPPSPHVPRNDALDPLAPNSPEAIEASPPPAPEPTPNGRHKASMSRRRMRRDSAVQQSTSGGVAGSALDRLRVRSRAGTTDSPNMFATSPASVGSEVLSLHNDQDGKDEHAADESQLFGPRSATAAAAATASTSIHHHNGQTNRANGPKLVSERQGGSVTAGDHSFGISGASLENTFGFKLDLENLQMANAHSDFNYLTVMSLEVHVLTRGNLRPDPEHDAIVALFYNIQNNVPDHHGPAECVGIIMQTPSDAGSAADVAALRRMAQTAHPALPIDVCCVRTERELMQRLLGLVAHWDPDIFAGYEIEMASWGYVLSRGQVLNINLKMMLSRVPSQYQTSAGASKGAPPAAAPQQQPIADEPPPPPQGAESQGEFYGAEYAEFEVRLSGRIFLDVWRLMRSELTLTSYTFESCVYHVLHRRCPRYAPRDLTRMWNRPAATLAAMATTAVRPQRWTVLEYYVERVRGTLELLNQLDLIGRTCELAKLFGIQFYEVLSRGSQFRVESMMLRMAKPKNIIPVSPSVQQRAHMRAPEYLPLILEPLSRLYVDSMIVLDFQSLYPSQIIAYNYCFSTCLGRVEHLGQSDPFEFGASQLRMPPKLLRKLIARDLVTVSPCGVAFVSAAVREGVLPRMLREILDTRLMVKQSMKLHRDDRLLQRVLHSRQLGLKLMANVTYGYTAANFSGRMPCVEVGDSVVSKGRETLERAIQMVGANKRWRSRVVYGDTDSMFVLVPGRTREQAFAIGAEIAAAVTAANPDPVKLKLEKIYQPSILQTKKRYVGYMYETADQPAPVYEAKGIETVRRDGCPAVAKMLEKTLKILFETRDVSAVKRYVCRQFTKIIGGRANLQDFTFAKEFRGVAGYKPGASVPALELARRWLLSDRRAEPRRGERVPYVIVNGAPGVPLIRLVRSPLEFMADEGLTINAVYYIGKAIVPALNRCLLLIGADAGQWYAELPRPQLARPLGKAGDAGAAAAATGLAKKSTIAQYFATTSCPTDCGAQTKQSLCGDCQRQPHRTAVILTRKMALLDRRLGLLQRTCAACCADAGAGWSASERCASLDCPVLHVRCNGRRAHAQVPYLRELVDKYCS